MGEIRHQMLSGVKWTFIEKYSMKLVTFIMGLIMARLLTPSDYGLVGMIGVFTAVAGTFIDSGFGNALIRKIDRTEEDLNTVFYFNIAMSVIIYILLFFAAPWVADFYNEPILKDVMRVITVNMVLGSFNSVQGALFTANINFKALAKCSLTSSIVSGVAGICMAYYGFGVWSLVYQGMIGTVINSVCLWALSSWRPKLMYSWKSFRELFSYGSKLLASSLLHTIYSKLSSLFIGKFYPPKMLGYYDRGWSLSSLPADATIGVVGRVTFPVFARLQNDDSRLIAAYRKYVCLTSLVVFFVMFLLIAVAHPLVLVLLSEKWMPAVIYCQVFSLGMMFNHINSINLNLLMVKGRSDLFLRLEVVKKLISVLLLLAAVPLGVLAICISGAAYAQIAIVINTYYTGKLFGLGYWAQYRDFGRYVLYSAAACLPAFLLSYSPLSPWLVLPTGAVVAAGLYYLILRVQRDRYLPELKQIAREAAATFRRKNN